MTRLTDASWQSRARIAGVCQDCDDMPRVANAGATVVENDRELQIMHNGIKVLAKGYVQGNCSQLIWLLRGVHEPQEERCFYECLKFVRPGGVMIELGSNWAYYSLWFWKSVERAICHCIEVDTEFMQLGITHFELNGGRAIFTNAALGRPKLKPWHTEVVGNYVRTLPDGRIFGHRPHPTPGFHRNVPLITVDGYVRDNNLEFIDILHSDIQGEEGPMLQAATETFGAKKVGFVFISTHSDHMHAACADFLGKYGYKIIAGHSIADSFSGDGLIVAKLPTYAGPDHIPLSKRTEICSV